MALSTAVQEVTVAKTDICILRKNKTKQKKNKECNSSSKDRVGLMHRGILGSKDVCHQNFVFLHLSAQVFFVLSHSQANGKPGPAPGLYPTSLDAPVGR